MYYLLVSGTAVDTLYLLLVVSTTSSTAVRTNRKTWKKDDRFWIPGAFYKNFTPAYYGTIINIHGKGPTVKFDDEKDQQAWKWEQFHAHAKDMHTKPYIVNRTTCRICATTDGDKTCAKCDSSFHQRCLDEGGWAQNSSSESFNHIMSYMPQSKSESAHTYNQTENTNNDSME